jgi:WD40 repeat protein
LFFSDFVIKIIDIDSSNSRTCSGHEAPVLSVALDPQEEFVVSNENSINNYFDWKTAFKKLGGRLSGPVALEIFKI